MGGRRRCGALRQQGRWQGHHRHLTPLCLCCGWAWVLFGGHSAGLSAVQCCPSARELVGASGDGTHSRACLLPFSATTATRGVVGAMVGAGHPCAGVPSALAWLEAGGAMCQVGAFPTVPGKRQTQHGGLAVVGRGLGGREGGPGEGHCHVRHVLERQPRQSQVWCQLEAGGGEGARLQH